MNSAQTALRPGEWVRVRSPEEIQETLDGQGELAGLPFMPEMLSLVGQQFRVLRRVEAACAAEQVLAVRRFTGVVHLEGLRCDGSYHGSCQASCLFFWHEAWLERCRALESRGTRELLPNQPLLPILQQWTTLDSSVGERPCYRCQATQLWQASHPLPAWDLRQYARQILFNKTTVRRVVGSVLRSVWHKLRRRITRGGQHLAPGERTPSKRLHLEVGEWVEVLPMEQISATLDEQDKNRGLWFDPQMAQYCGGRFRVAAKIERIIDEGTGRMIHFKSPAVSLETIGCDGCWHRFCSREAPLFWREIWLKRVEATAEEPLQPQNVF